MILGCDAAGIDEDGNEVVVHAVISDPSFSGGDETMDPKRSLLSERYQGTFAEQVAVPRANVIPKPASLSFEEAACLPTAWLTAYRMLFVQGGCRPGDTVLVQGAGGGVATALISLARAGGLRVFATSRDETKRQRALELGAHEVFETGQRLPVTVDAVMETVGKATWLHSIRSLRVGGTLVTSGATSGNDVADMGLTRIFFLQLKVVGSTMGTRGELASLVAMLDATGTRPLIDRVLPMDRAEEGFAAMADGEVFGKVVFTPMRHLVTGAGSGIGEALADALHARGDELVLLARNAQRADDLRSRYASADVRVADLADPGSIAAAVAGLDSLDSVVHVAGIFELAAIAELPLADLTSQLTVNLVAPAELTRAVLPALRSARGTVVFVNSGQGLAANPEWGAYAASKHGLRAVADALRAEEAPAGVRVTSVFLGRTATPMQQKVHEQEGLDYDPADWAAPATVAATLVHVLDLPADATVSDVSVRPRPR